MAKSGWGERMKARARELGLTDAAVARALGIGQHRYSAYANESREPDFATLARICAVLRTTPDALLGYGSQPAGSSDDDASLARLAAAAMAMSGPDRARAVAVMETLAAHPGTETSGGSDEQLPA